MEKKKLLLISPTLHQGGLERICAWTAEMMAPYFEVTVAVFDLADAIYDLGDIPVRNLQVPAQKKKLQKVLNVLKRAVKLHRLKKELKIDIAYSLGLTASKANVLSCGPGEIWSGLHSYMDLDGTGQLPMILKRSDKVLCCSGAIAQVVKREYGCKKAVAVYNPYDSKNIRTLSKQKIPDMPDLSEHKVVVNVGRSDDVKGFWHLIKSFSLVHRKMPDTRLLFVGNGDFSEYQKLAEDLGLADAVCFAGVQKNPFPWVTASDLFVLTSRNEGFPNALVEAMILGVPAIAANCKSGPAEILTDRFEEMEGITEPVNDGYGILIPELPFEKDMDASHIDPAEEKLAEQILRLFSDEAARAKLGRAAAKRAELFSREAYVEAFCQLAGVPCKKGADMVH